MIVDCIVTRRGLGVMAVNGENRRVRTEARKQRRVSEHVVAEGVGGVSVRVSVSRERRESE